jgi:hypothetical protein
MANPRLFASSLVLGFLHLLLLLLHQPVPRIFAVNVLCGIFSSIWNHGATLEVAKWSDRTMMAVGAVVDGVYLFALGMPHREWLARAILAAIAAFLLAKYILAALATSEAAAAAAATAAVAAARVANKASALEAAAAAEPSAAADSSGSFGSGSGATSARGGSARRGQSPRGVAVAPRAATGAAATAAAAGAAAGAAKSAPKAQDYADVPHLLAHVLLSCTHFAMIRILNEHCGSDGLGGASERDGLDPLVNLAATAFPWGRALCAH